MKKTIVVILCLVLCLSAISLSGCGETNTGEQGDNTMLMTEEKALEIRTAYLNNYLAKFPNNPANVEDVSIYAFYGNYNEAYVVEMSGLVDYPAVVGPNVLERIEVYYSGEFFSLYGALKNGMLTRENLSEIENLELFRERHPRVESIYEEITKNLLIID